MKVDKCSPLTPTQPKLNPHIHLCLSVRLSVCLSVPPSLGYQVCAQVHEAHEGAGLPGAQRVQRSPGGARPALWLPAAAVPPAGPQPPEEALSGPGEEGGVGGGGQR